MRRPVTHVLKPGADVITRLLVHGAKFTYSTRAYIISLISRNRRAIFLSFSRRFKSNSIATLNAPTATSRIACFNDVQYETSTGMTYAL